MSSIIIGATLAGAGMALAIGLSMACLAGVFKLCAMLMDRRR